MSKNASNMKASQTTAITLSLNKLQKLLQDNFYTLVNLYCENENVKFLEVRTPRIQKTFIIVLPEKYKLTYEGNSHKKIDIYHSDEKDSRQLEYLTDLKGPLLDCDLVSISSFLICVYKNNGDFATFKFGKEEIREIDEESEDSEIVDRLIKDVNAISEKIDPELKIIESGENNHQEENQDEPEDNEQSDLEESGVEDHVEPVEPVEEVELVFEDENGTKFAGEASGILEENIVVPETALAPKKKKRTKILEFSNRKANFVPENLETLDLTLGIIYFSIDVDKFYKKVNRQIDIEEDIINVYDIIDENENDLRAEKADNIMELCAKLTLKVKEEVEKYKKEEDHLKNQILKLSLILDNTEKLKKKIDGDEKKFLDSKNEIYKLYNQTKTTFHDINLEILRNKDRIDDFLVQYHSALEEMLN